MDVVVYWFFFSIRSIVVVVITFYGFKFTPYFFPRSDLYHRSAFDVLKKRLYMTGIVFVVAANILFIPELWWDKIKEKTDIDYSAQETVQNTPAPIPPVVESKPIAAPIPIEPIPEPQHVETTPEPDNVEALADHQLYDVENKTDNPELPAKPIAEKPVSAIPGY